jgi:hypothetical protein
MNTRKVYSDPPRFYVNGVEVNEDAYLAAQPPSKFEAMIASGQLPSIRTDSTWLAGVDNANGKQFEGQEYAGDFYRQKALEGGVNPVGKVYLSSLAKFPGDPEAWVSGRGDIQRIVDKNGWEAEGTVTAKGREHAPPKEVPLGEDIVNEELLTAVEDNPDLAASRQKVEDKRQEIVEKRTPHWAKKKAAK